jgi:Na+:H+ antiporter, NhaA family
LSVLRRSRALLRDFLRHEAAGGILLMATAAIALGLANAPFAPTYYAMLRFDIAGMTVLHWINDGLMAFFFLLVGLEIKRELLEGELATWPRRALPAIAATGGMVVPALVYLTLNLSETTTRHGWAIPTATDIAFALGVLALLGKRVPGALKVFLTALAILDDIGAVLIIALFYASDLSLLYLGAAGLTLAILHTLNRWRVARLAPYLALGALLWFFVLESGVHPALAGVMLASAVPLRPSEPTGASPLHALERRLGPWSSFAIVPLFGLANAGVSLHGLAPSALLDPLALGVAAGLFVGKQVGVFGSAWLAVRLGLAKLPHGMAWAQLYGVAVLCGIGFTMSLFVGMLAFDADVQQNEAKLGILAGSFLSAFVGWLVIRGATKLPSA